MIIKKPIFNKFYIFSDPQLKRFIRFEDGISFIVSSPELASRFEYPPYAENVLKKLKESDPKYDEFILCPCSKTIITRYGGI